MEWIQEVWQSFNDGVAAAGNFSVFVLLSALIFFLFLAAIAGCVVPVLPGPALAFLAVVIWKLTLGSALISWIAVAICLFLAIIATLLDYWLPVKYTPTRAGALGAFIGVFAGLIVGIVFPLFAIPAIFLGPLLFAFMFEYNSNKDFQKAWKSGKGAFVGTVLGIFAKILMILMMIGVVLVDVILV